MQIPTNLNLVYPGLEYFDCKLELVRSDKVSISRSKLPPLPPALATKRVEASDTVFIAWDIMQPWGITAIAFLKEAGGITVWTPLHCTSWIWRGPRHIPEYSAKLLSQWLLYGDDSIKNAVIQGTPDFVDHIELKGEAIWIWDTNPKLEGGIGIHRLPDKSCELALMMAGLRRGGAHIQREEVDVLAHWLLDNKDYVH
jgi:hypothetical protein